MPKEISLVVPEVVDFGVGLPGEILHGEVVVRNNLAHAIHVRDVKTSCSCTVAASKSFDVPAHGSYTLVLNVTPDCPYMAKSFVHLVTGQPDGVTFFVQGTCQHPFADMWEHETDTSVRVPVRRAFDTQRLQSLACYWNQRDDPSTTTIETDEDGASWLVIDAPVRGRRDTLDIVYKIVGFSKSVVLRLKPDLDALAAPENNKPTHTSHGAHGERCVPAG